MFKSVLTIGAAGLSVLCVNVAIAQSTDDTAVPVEQIQPLAIGFCQSGLSGEGADLLRRQLSDAQFIGIGEDHGFAAAPALVAALAKEAAPYGEYHYAVETGPWTAAWLQQRLRDNGVDGLAKDLAGRPLAVPFMVLREEAEVAAMFSDPGKLWGIDQEFIGSPMIHLEWLAGRGDDGEGTVRALFEAEKSAFATGDQASIFMASADEALWTKLRGIYAEDTDALQLIDALQTSQTVYKANFEGRGFDNNTDRVQLIRQYFLDNYARASAKSQTPPRVLYKLGAVHVGRATSPMKTFDIGSLVEGIAAANGLDALHIAYLPIGGEQLAIRPSAEGAFATVAANQSAELAKILRSANVDLSAVEGSAEHYIIDLEPVRRSLGNSGLNDADAMSRFVLLGFDYLVTTGAAKAGSPLAER